MESSTERLDQRQTESQQDKHQILNLYIQLLGLWMSQLGSIGLSASFTLPILLHAASVASLLGQLPSMLAALLSRCPMSLLSSTSWGSHGKLGFIFTAFQDLPVKNPALLQISWPKSCFRTTFWHPLKAPITPHSWILHVSKTTWTMLPSSAITLRCSLPLLCRNYSDLWGLW